MKGLVNQIALVVFAVLALATLLLTIFNDKGMLKVQEQAQKLSSIQSDILNAEAENQKLTGEIQALRTDPATIEKLAREELKLVKPDEVVLVTPSETPSTAPPAPQPER